MLHPRTLRRGYPAGGIRIYMRGGYRTIVLYEIIMGKNATNITNVHQT